MASYPTHKPDPPATAGLAPAEHSLAGYNADPASLFRFNPARTPMPEPLYTAASCRIAYQLHWSLALFAKQPWPEKDAWWQPLRQAIEADGVRLLEFEPIPPTTGQFLVSSKP